MAANTKIEWATHSWNPWRGCSKVSAGCANCYAETQAGRNPGTLGVWGPNGTRVVAAEAMWREPLKWDTAAAVAGERHRVFCASMADVFEDWAGPVVTHKGARLFVDEFDGPWKGNVDSPVTLQTVRARLFALIRRTPRLDWLLLTKRPQNVARMVDGYTGPLPGNVWLGTSVEDQAAADERIPHLLNTPAAVRFLSCEPLLGPVDLRSLSQGRDQSPDYLDSLTGFMHSSYPPAPGPKIDWVIVGGESGPGARPMHPDWARSLRDQCQAAGVAFHFKQWGEFLHVHPKEIDRRVRLVQIDGAGAKCGPETFGSIVVQPLGKKATGRLLDGRTWDELPAPRGA